MTEDQRVAEAVADKLLGVKRYQCDHCDFGTDDIEELDEVEDLHQRIYPGDIMPAGECPECGACVYGGDQDLIDSGNLSYFAKVLRRQGYTVIEPKS